MKPNVGENFESEIQNCYIIEFKMCIDQEKIIMHPEEQSMAHRKQNNLFFHIPK